MQHLLEQDFQTEVLGPAKGLEREMGDSMHLQKKKKKSASLFSLTSNWNASFLFIVNLENKSRWY